MGHRLDSRADAKFRFGIIEVERNCVARDTKDATCLPSRFALCSPSQTFHLARRQNHAFNWMVCDKLAASVCVEIHRDELKNLCMVTYRTLKFRSSLVGGEGHGGDGATAV